jgi:hypothetical protein
MMKKSINSANIDFDSRKRNFSAGWFSESRLLLRPRAVRSLRLWNFFSTFAFLLEIKYDHRLGRV